MPELPEVETVKRGLINLVIGKVVSSVDFDWPKSFPNSPADVDKFLIKSTIIGVRRRAKVLLVDLSSDYTMVIHLKMTGQLVFVGRSEQPKEDALKSSKESKDEIRFGAGHPNDSLIGSLPDKSTRVIFTMTDKSNLYFNDQRKFGWVRLVPTVDVPKISFMQKVGPEPLDDSFTEKIFISRLRKRANTSIKAAILDQTVLAGVGNIYADEALWGASINPSVKVKDLSDDRLRKLYSEIRQVLSLSIEKGGSTDRNYVDAEGNKGSYLQFAKVFRREGKPCFRCNSTIAKIRVAGRGTHVCSSCQK